MIKLTVLPLTSEAFRPYGDVIETQGRDFFHINNDQVQRYHDLAKVDILQQDRPLISINRAQPVALPIVIAELERHPLGSQAFIPMNREKFIVVVALGEEEPDMQTLRAFMTDGRQGINYHRNVWHYPLFAWQTVTEFLTVDRAGSSNCEVVNIPVCQLYFPETMSDSVDYLT